MTIKEAIYSLDVTDDSLWTADGLPRVDVVQELVDDDTITRQQITDADPSFSRRQDRPSGHAEPEELPTMKDIQDYDHEINELEIQQQNIAREIRILNSLRDELVAKNMVHSTSQDDTRARIEYIKKQGQLRAERIGRQRDLLKGIDINSLDSRAPLDRSFARDTRRGTIRPNIPVNTESTQNNAS